jgi:hypothetical protein
MVVIDEEPVGLGLLTLHGWDRSVNKYWPGETAEGNRERPEDIDESLAEIAVVANPP